MVPKCDPNDLIEMLVGLQRRWQPVAKRFRDPDRCPPIIRDECVVHIPFKMKAIKFALDNWPGKMQTAARAQGARVYSDDQYHKLGL